MTLPGAGEEISRVAFENWAVTLSTEEGSELRVEGPFDLTVDGSTTGRVDPSHVAPHAASLLRQLRRRVTAVRVLDGGGLELRINGDFSMLVHPGHEFEAWTYNGSDDSVAVGLPGGDVGTWRPR